MPAQATTERVQSAQRRLDITHAWRRYLAELRGVEPARYDEVEPWAWERLQTKLRSLQ